MTRLVHCITNRVIFVSTKTKKTNVMANNKFTVSEVPGSSRKSPREYTHAVIGVYDWAARLRRDDVDYKTDGENWQYYSNWASVKPGENYRFENYNFPFDQKSYDKAIEIVAKYPTKQSYITGMRENRVADTTTRMNAEGANNYVVLRWSQSLANAHKGHGEFSLYINLKVVPTVKL